MKKLNSLSLIVSFLNEEETIPELIRRIQNTLESIQLSNYEIIFVNDNSTDKSLDILIAESEQDSRIKVINMSRKFGQAPCVMAGLKHCIGDAAIVIDADLQDPPELIPKMVEEYNNGAEVVNTTRLSRAGENPVKMMITRWAYRVLRFTSNMDLPLDSGDFKLIDRKVIDHLTTFHEKDPFVRGLVTWIGFKQSQVFYHREPRFAGRTHMPLIGMGPLNAFVSGLVSFSTVPLNLILLLGFSVAFLAFAALVTLGAMFFSGYNLPTWTGLAAGMLLIGGTQLIGIGFLGLYLGRVYAEVKGRPSYIVRDTINVD